MWALAQKWKETKARLEKPIVMYHNLYKYCQAYSNVERCEQLLCVRTKMQLGHME